MTTSQGQAFLSQLADIKQDLPYSPGLLRDMFSLTNESSPASLERIGQTITQDQGLTAKILALANSAFYGLQGKVTSVSRAAALIGMKEIRNLVLALGIQALTHDRPLPRDFDLYAYWEHNLATGVCAKLLAERVQAEDPEVSPDSLFTAGMLHDFGKLLTAIHRPEDYSIIHKQAHDQDLPYCSLEEGHWGIEHGVIGAMTLNSWNLPKELTEPVNWHHAPEHAPEFAVQAKLLCLADALHHSLLDPEKPLSSQAMALLLEFGFNYKEICKELEWVMEDDSLEQFISHLS
ncbi:MAG: HDOD domain-containing protein [Desulfovibrio sp.]|nr:MAG: HDOD domain-containing protein [Desulfovibrio sp.]